ncbi:uncharacterized protein LOC135682375 [Rhopilema esculentum]|uniref:uncharacterized protein LOC135682375 n=1 Tax=Rhopilema esculentum TaxID=499914 RepID=UPI0031DF9596|eukprot:gene14347-5390_t
MSFWYQVILKPLDVKFTSSKVSSKFKNGRLLNDLLDDLLEGRKLIKDSPFLEVVWSVEKWEWYTLDNRLLWVYRQLEKEGKVSYIEMRRIEFSGKANAKPKYLYEDTEVVEEDIDEPNIELPAGIKIGKKGEGMRCISKKLKRLHLSTVKSSKKGFKTTVKPKIKKDCNDNCLNSEEILDDVENVNATAVSEDDKSQMKVESTFEAVNVKIERADNANIDTPCRVEVSVEKNTSCDAVTDLPDSLEDTEKVESKNEIANQADDFSIRFSRSPSVCSSISDGRGIDDWGRKGKRLSVDLEDLDESRENDGDDEDEWIAIDDINAEIDQEERSSDANDDVFSDNETARKTVEVRTRYSEDSGLDGLQRQKGDSNGHSKNNLFIKPKRKSLSESLLSLDSAFSSSSALSLSSITRDQRQISSLSGLHGYGNFDRYNAEYLSKLRAERQAAKQRLKPYDVSRSRYSKAASSLRDEEDWDSASQGRSRSSSCFTNERVTTRRTYSETLHYRGCRGVSFREKSYHESQEVVYSSSSRRYTLPRRNTSASRSRTSSLSEKYLPNDRRRSFYGSDSKLSSSGQNTIASALKKGHFSKEKLYNIWQIRREEYLDARYSSSLSSMSVALMGYTCGLCFKSFKTRTRLEQHSEELMHWACVTCGRFFASHTALGQHIEKVGHRKD